MSIRLFAYVSILRHQNYAAYAAYVCWSKVSCRLCIKRPLTLCKSVLNKPAVLVKSAEAKVRSDAAAAVPRVLNCEREHWRLFRMTKEDPDGSWIQVPAGIPVGHFMSLHSSCVLSDHCRGLILLKITSGETRDKNCTTSWWILSENARWQEKVEEEAEGCPAKTHPRNNSHSRLAKVHSNKLKVLKTVSGCSGMDGDVRVSSSIYAQEQNTDVCRQSMLTMSSRLPFRIVLGTAKT